MKHRIIYKVRCLCNDWKGKFYIGQHTTYDLNDGYAGSGELIGEYYKLYGKKLNVTYTFKILKDGIKSQAELDAWERKYIQKYLGTEKCLNKGEGGLDEFNVIRDKFHVVYTNDDGTYHNCDYSYEDTEEIKRAHFDDETNKLINKLKKDRFNFEIRKKLTDRLLRYSLTPSLLNL